MASPISSMPRSSTASPHDLDRRPLTALFATPSGDVPDDEDRPAHHSEVMTTTKRIASLLIVLSSLAVPTAAFAADDSSPAGDGGCFYTDEDGYDIPIFDGEGVIVDGKLVTCKSGELTIERAPRSHSMKGDLSRFVIGGEQVALPGGEILPTTHRTSRVSRSTSPLLASL